MRKTSQAAMWGQVQSHMNVSVHTKTPRRYPPSEHDKACLGAARGGIGEAVYTWRTGGYPGGGGGEVCTRGGVWWMST